MFVTPFSFINYTEHLCHFTTKEWQEWTKNKQYILIFPSAYKEFLTSLTDIKISIFCEFHFFTRSLKRVAIHLYMNSFRRSVRWQPGFFHVFASCNIVIGFVRVWCNKPSVMTKRCKEVKCSLLWKPRLWRLSAVFLIGAEADPREIYAKEDAVHL